MYEKYPATQYIREPQLYYAAAPQKQVEAETLAINALRLKTVEFIKSEHGQRLATIVEDARRKYELAQETLKTACVEHTGVEHAVLNQLEGMHRRAYQDKIDLGPMVEAGQRFHDRNWVDEEEEKGA